MEILIVVLYFFLLWYILNIFWLVIGFHKVPVYRYKRVTNQNKFSIVVPFRNEKDNLPKLLNSISKLQYSKDLYEVILVDDASEDGWEMTQQLDNVVVVKNSRTSISPKKDAIQTAIAIAKNEWIVTTDADCQVPVQWLALLDACIQKESPRMLASGVLFTSYPNFRAVFQQMDLLSLQGVTIGSFGNRQAFMCNGANFCYQKSFFQELNGFEGNSSIASGDDVFLLQKASLYSPKDVFYLKSNQSLVLTQPEKSWKAIFNQRVRWASKTNNYNSIYSRQLAVSVFMTNVILVSLSIVSFFYNNGWEILLWFFAIKFCMDYILLRLTASFYQQPLRYMLPSSILYSFFSVTVAVYSLFGNYQWKGRVFSK